MDKALDIYYLSIAYLAAMRNWTSDAAFRVAQFLFYYRLIGSVLFELTDTRVMLLLVPEHVRVLLHRLRARAPALRAVALLHRSWVLAAAGLWVFVKLPQEYWIHVAKLDFTDTVKRLPGVRRRRGARAARRGGRARPRVLPRLPAPDWDGGSAADRLPASLVEGSALRRRLETPRVLTNEALEQVCLLALLCFIFASMLPGVDATILQVVVGVAAIVLANDAISLAAERRGGFRAQLGGGALRGRAGGRTSS